MGKLSKEIIFIFAFCFKEGQLLKERICSPWEQILSFKSRPNLKRYMILCLETLGYDEEGCGQKFSFTNIQMALHLLKLHIQSNLNDSNTFGTMKICSRKG